MTEQTEPTTEQEPVETAAAADTATTTEQEPAAAPVESPAAAPATEEKAPPMPSAEEQAAADAELLFNSVFAPGPVPLPTFTPAEESDFASIWPESAA
jgi:hypothetical protein